MHPILHYFTPKCPVPKRIFGHPSRCIPISIKGTFTPQNYTNGDSSKCRGYPWVPPRGGYPLPQGVLHATPIGYRGLPPWVPEPPLGGSRLLTQGVPTRSGRGSSRHPLGVPEPPIGGSRLLTQGVPTRSVRDRRRHPLGVPLPPLGGAACSPREYPPGQRESAAVTP